MQFVRGLSDLIIVYSAVPAEKIGKGAVSYEEADEKEASNILLLFDSILIHQVIVLRLL